MRRHAAWRGGHRSAVRHAAGVVALTAACSLRMAGAAAAQGLEQYDYENLGLRALGAEVVYADAKDAESAVGFGVRADLGFLGPYVRLVPRFAVWKADIEDEAVARFERNLEELCVADACDISLGSLKRNFWVLGLDFQWTLSNPVVSPYLGLGFDAYLLDDSGEAIEGTFLDDAVVTAGLSGVAGLEVGVGKGLILYGEFRGTLVTSASNLAGHAGLALRF